MRNVKRWHLLVAYYAPFLAVWCSISAYTGAPLVDLSVIFIGTLVYLGIGGYWAATETPGLTPVSGDPTMPRAREAIRRAHADTDADMTRRGAKVARSGWLDHRRTYHVHIRDDPGGPLTYNPDDWK